MSLNNPQKQGDVNASTSDSSEPVETSKITRRDFILDHDGSSHRGGAVGNARRRRSVSGIGFPETLIPEDKKLSADWLKSLAARGKPTTYRGRGLENIGMPVGGICCGQLYLGGDGKLWHWDLFNLPQPANFSDSGGPNYARPPKPESPIEQGFALKVTVGGKSETRQLDSRGFRAEDIAFQGQYPVATIDTAPKSCPSRFP